MSAPEAVDEPWWCWECHGMGSWYEDEQETDEPGEVECPCCLGDGNHEGDSAPACHPAAAAPTPRTVRSGSSWTTEERVAREAIERIAALTEAK